MAQQYAVRHRRRHRQPEEADLGPLVPRARESCKDEGDDLLERIEELVA